MRHANWFPRSRVVFFLPRRVEKSGEEYDIHVHMYSARDITGRWNIMNFHAVPWDNVRSLWMSWEVDGIQWDTSGYSGYRDNLMAIRWDTVRYQDVNEAPYTPWDTMRILYDTVGYRGIPWDTLRTWIAWEVGRVPWEVGGIPWDTLGKVSEISWDISGHSGIP